MTDGSSTVFQSFFSIKITDLNLKDGYPIPDAFVGSPYSYQLTTFNSTGAVTGATTFGACGTNPIVSPPGSGMSLSSTGLISGTPLAPGNYNINFSIS